METVIIYAIVHLPNENVSMKYAGMGIQVISDMLAERGLTATVVTQEEYEAFEINKLASLEL